MSFFRDSLPGWLFLVIFVPNAHGQTATPPALESLLKSTASVGDYGDLSKLEIQGANAFTPEAIRAALGRNFLCLIAAHPKSKLRDLVPTLRDEILLGYRRAGFAEAHLDIAIDQQAGHLRATIVEGPCFTAGTVRLEGAKRIDSARLIERIIQPHPPELATASPDSSGQIHWLDPSGNPLKLLPPVWPLGRPAPLDGAPGQATPWGDELCERQSPGLYFAVEKSMASLGFYFPKFTLRIDLDRNKSEAHLTVILKDEGPEPILTAITLEGNQRNSREEILSDLQLTPGILLTREELTRIKTRLWSCGRFAKSDVTPMQTPGPCGKLAVTIAIVEYPKAPRLCEPLSPAEGAMLRLRNWLAQSGRWQGDLVVSYRKRDALFDTIVSPGEGTLFQIKDPSGELAGAPIEATLVASHDEVGYYSAARRLSLTGLQTGLVAALGMRLQDDFLTEQDQPFILTFGLGIESVNDETRTPPFNVSLELQPAAFLAHLHEHEAKATLEGGILSVATSEHTSRSLLRVDAGTGQLLEYAIFEPSAKSTAESPWSVRIFLARGEYDRRLDTTHKRAEQGANAFDGNHPVSSTLAFFAGEPAAIELLKKSPDADRLLGACRTMLERGIAAPLDAYVLASTRCDNKFVIPCPATREPAPQSLQEIAAGWLLSCNNAMFPAGSWPWNLGDQWLPLAAGVSGGEDLDLSSLLLSMGPLSQFATGCLFEPLGDGLGAVFATQGLACMVAPSFQKDCRPLLDQRALIGQCIHRGAEILRSMSDEDFSALGRDLPPTAAEGLRVARRTLCDVQDKPLDQTLNELMPKLWKAGIDKWLDSALKAMKERNSQSSSETI